MGYKRVTDFFSQKGIKKDIVTFEKSTESSALAAEVLQVEVGQIAKSILFIGDGKPYMVVISGDKRVDEKKMKVVTGCKKVRMASRDQVLAYTGHDVGGVSPVGHIETYPIYIDISLKRYSEIYPAAGEHNNMFATTYDELMDMTQGAPADVSRA